MTQIKARTDLGEAPSPELHAALHKTNTRLIDAINDANPEIKANAVVSLMVSFCAAQPDPAATCARLTLAANLAILQILTNPDVGVAGHA